MVKVARLGGDVERVGDVELLEPRHDRLQVRAHAGRRLAWRRDVEADPEAADTAAHAADDGGVVGVGVDDGRCARQRRVDGGPEGGGRRRRRGVEGEAGAADRRFVVVGVAVQARRHGHHDGVRAAAAAGERPVKVGLVARRRARVRAAGWP